MMYPYPIPLIHSDIIGITSSEMSSVANPIITPIRSQYLKPVATNDDISKTMQTSSPSHRFSIMWKSDTKQTAQEQICLPCTFDSFHEQFPEDSITIHYLIIYPPKQVTKTRILHISIQRLNHIGRRRYLQLCVIRSSSVSLPSPQELHLLWKRKVDSTNQCTSSLPL